MAFFTIQAMAQESKHCEEKIICINEEKMEALAERIEVLAEKIANDVAYELEEGELKQLDNDIKRLSEDQLVRINTKELERLSAEIAAVAEESARVALEAIEEMDLEAIFDEYPFRAKE